MTPSGRLGRCQVLRRPQPTPGRSPVGARRIGVAGVRSASLHGNGGDMPLGQGAGRSVHLGGPARRIAALVAVTAGLALTACGVSQAGSATRSHPATDPSPLPASGPDPTAPPPGPAQGRGNLDTFYRIPVKLNPAPPGAIVRSSPIPSTGQLPAGAKAYRVIYHSQSIAGTDVAVSGLIVVPGGPPPVGGFPIASWAHGTTGLAAQCAPSLGSLSSIPYLVPLLKAGMIVAATDYRGPRNPRHPSLPRGSERGPGGAGRGPGRTKPRRRRPPPTAVVVLGYSQGGQAALFAGQIAGSYAPELFVAGVVAIGPVTSLTELAPSVPGADTDPSGLRSHGPVRMVGYLRQPPADIGVHRPRCGPVRR